MKLKDEFITHNSDDESMLIPTADAKFSGIVRGNKTMGKIIDMLKEETTEDEIVSRMLEIYDIPEEIVRNDVKMVIENLTNIGALS
jgi:hypothetical protein